MGTVNKSPLDKALLHIEQEIGFQNIRASIKSNYEIIQKTHDSIHEFMYLVSFSLPVKTEVNWHSKSAFLTYHWEAFHQAHRSSLEAVSGYYSAAYVLLRSTLELILRGAFWECLAHKSFREKATILGRGKGKRKSLRGWIEDLIEQNPSVEKDLEETSVAILDKTAILFSVPEFQKQFVQIPSFSEIVNQLIDWHIVDIPKPFDTLYGNLYGDLSKDVHALPDATDVGRKLLSERDFMEIKVMSDELVKYMKTLHEVIDIGIVVELNILRDWIESGDKIRLKERLTTLEDLGLKYSVTKLKSLIA
ncbi:hypothetical protein ACFLXK_02130 [Chloroflexota bacterium]